MTFKVMAVCAGNICRSPMAEAVLRQRFADAGLSEQVQVTSAGTTEEEQGKPADPRAMSILREAGYEVPQNCAHQITRQDLAEQDLLLAMTARGARWLRAQAAGLEAVPQIVLFRAFENGPDEIAPAESAIASADSSFDLADPVRGNRESFRDTLRQVEAAADAIVDHVRTQLDS